jgi:cation/acetate symporter
MVSGLLSSILMVVMGPMVMNPEDGLILSEPISALTNPGLVSIPVGFLGAIVGTLCSRPAPGADERFNLVLYQAHTGKRMAKNRELDRKGA